VTTADADAPHARIDLGALAANVAALRSRLAPGVRLMAAVKADAYGHGVARVAPALRAAGVDAFGVATAAEALAVRVADPSVDVLVFAPVRARVAELVDADVALTVAGPEALAAIEGSGAQSRARVHLKVDTGMARLGLGPAAAVELAVAVDRSRHAQLEGVWTHLAAADDPDAAEAGSRTDRQLTDFRRALADLTRAGCAPASVHAANTAAVITRPDAHFDLVRPGIGLYGQPPSAHVAGLAPELRPVLTVDAPVVFVKRVRVGTAVGYGGGWTAPCDTVIATVRLGYADGYPRSLSSIGRASLHGRTVSVAGRVCMDQVMLDLGPDGGATVGDRAVFVGGAGPSAVEVAATAGSFVYELVTGWGDRVERVYED
jgi:alanine racemase